MPDPDNLYAHAVAVIQQEALRHIEEAVSVATRCFYLDEEHNKGAVFGYVFWQNLTERLMQASSPETRLRWGGDVNDRHFRVGLDILRFHRVPNNTLVPEGAEAAKSACRRADSPQHELFRTAPFGLGLGIPVERSLLVGIVASPYFGLQRVTVGELVWSGEPPQYRYDHPVAEVMSDLVLSPPLSSVPAEPIPTAVVTLKAPPVEDVPSDSVRLDERSGDHPSQEATGTEK
jgi:hypothetical protein